MKNYNKKNQKGLEGSRMRGNIGNSAIMKNGALKCDCGNQPSIGFGEVLHGKGMAVICKECGKSDYFGMEKLEKIVKNLRG